MNILCFCNSLGLGGTEKAACRWARGLKEAGHAVQFVTLKDGARRAELTAAGIEAHALAPDEHVLAKAFADLAPDVIHTHAPGHPHEGDILGRALATRARKIPVVQTNIFGRLEDPLEDAWTDYRLFISWTSCVQAARRSFQRLNREFFRRNSVAVYPVDAVTLPAPATVAAFRHQHGITDDEVLFGRFSRPDPSKWTDLALNAFRLALRTNPKLKLLLREPPQDVVQRLRASPDSGRFVILKATSDPVDLHLSMAALDAVLHTSSIGESFGYGIAEPMNLGKPVITHSVPWQDQAQIELVPHGECGYVVGTESAMAAAIVTLAHDRAPRLAMGSKARQHILTVADAQKSIARLEATLHCATTGRDNPFASEDLATAQATAARLDQHQFGHSIGEQIALRPLYYRVRFHELRKTLRLRSYRRKQAGNAS